MKFEPYVVNVPTTVRISQPPYDPFLDYLEQVELPRLERNQKFANMMVKILGGSLGVLAAITGIWWSLL